MTKRTVVTFVAGGLVVFLTAGVDATNGYFSTGYGTESKGVAGAGAATATDTLAPALNPATLVFVPDQIDVSASAFNPNRSYTVLGPPSGIPGTFGLAPGTVSSGSRLFVVPAFGVARKAGARGVLGLAMYGNGGMNTNYRAPTFGAAPAGVDLAQMFLAPTYARSLGARHAVGITAIIGYQRFAASGLQAFSPFSSDRNRLTNNDHANSFGGGVRVGYTGTLSRHLSVGASYQSRIWMSKFDEYQGLFAGNGSFDVPSTWVAGVAVKPTANLDLLADVQQVRYSEVTATGNALMPNLMQAPLGSDTGAGFGWNDMTTYKFGVQQRLRRGWTWRAGYSFGRQPIPASEVLFNILAPGVEERHATVGLSKTVGRDKALGVAVTRAFSNRVTGPNPLEVPGRQQIGIEMDQWDVQIGYTIKLRR